MYSAGLCDGVGAIERSVSDRRSAMVSGALERALYQRGLGWPDWHDNVGEAVALPSIFGS